MWQHTVSGPSLRSCLLRVSVGSRGRLAEGPYGQARRPELDRYPGHGSQIGRRRTGNEPALRLGAGRASELAVSGATQTNRCC